MVEPMRQALLFAILAGCNFNLSSVAAFDIPYDIPAQTVPGNAIANQAGIAVDFSLPAFPINVDVAQQAQQNGVGGVISTVTLTTMSFTITQGTCFDFANNLSITISSTKAGSALPPAVIATGASPGCVTTWNLTATNVNLKPYLDEGAQAAPSGNGIPPAADETFTGHLVAHASL
jgi:hypothetical protein